MQRWLGVFLVVTAVLGCDDAADDADSGMADILVRSDATIADEGVEPDTGETPDEGVEADVLPPDMGLVRNLETCEDICGVYDSCDRLDLWADDIDECLRGCADAELSDSFQNFRTCMQITACEDLDECVVPARPRPDCTDVCEVLDECGATARVPGGLPEVANCAAACNDPLLAQTLVNCGENIVYEPEACNEEDFASCVLGERQGDCLNLCERRAGCEEGIDVIECALACAQPAMVDDPVARRRVNIARTCAREARDCDELAACGQQIDRAIVGDATIEEMCAANEECGFLSSEGCVENGDALLRRLADGAVDCLTDNFTACDETPLGCFAPATIGPEVCDEYCAVSALCGTLPGGQVEFECVQQCRAAVASGDPALIAPLRPGLECAFGDTCADIGTCVDQAGAGADCAAYCARVGECGGDGGDACVDECLARGGTARGFAERTCLLAAADCEQGEACEAPAPPPCDVLCEPLEACDLGGPRCVDSCDDADFLDPGSFLPRLACAVSTARCDERAVCEQGDLSGGAACLAYCRRAAECGGGADDPVQCLVECGAGLPGAEGLVFDGARACLEAAGPDADCDALDGCIDAVPADGYCESFCAATVGCRLAEGNEACIAACRANAEDADQIEQAACAIAANRNGAGCAAVAECIGAEIEPATPACADLCAAQNACDENIDVFLCERDCMPEQPGTPVRAACAQRANCDQLQLCLDADGLPPAACVDVCAGLGMCPGAIGEEADARYTDADACLADCGGLEVLQGDGNADALNGCVDAAACDADALSACFDRGPSGSCQDAWDAFVVCNNQALLGLGDEMAYLMVCNDALMMDRATTQAQIDCVVQVAMDAMGDPLACFGQIGCLVAP